jgi:hypothetical protein
LLVNTGKASASQRGHREKGGSHCRCDCYTEIRQTKRAGREVAIAVLATQRVDELRQRVGRKPLPLCLLHREKTNYSKREGREVAIAAVFATQREDKLQ